MLRQLYLTHKKRKPTNKEIKKKSYMPCTKQSKNMITMLIPEWHPLERWEEGTIQEINCWAVTFLKNVIWKNYLFQSF